MPAIPGRPTASLRAAPNRSADQDAAFERLLAAGTEIGFRPNAVVLHPAVQSADVLVVVSGVLRACRTALGGRRQITALLQARDIVGPDIGSVSDLTIEAATAGRLCRVRRWRFDDLVREDAGIRELARCAAADQLTAARAHLAILRARSADLRVASLLLGLSRRGLLDGEASHVIWWPMSFTDMADYLGLSQETVSRSLSRLRRMGIFVHEQRHRFRVLDKAKLAALAVPSPSFDKPGLSGAGMLDACLVS